MYEDVLVQLSQNNTKYLVIGGVAVTLTGYVRNTLDLDILPELSKQNLEKIIEVTTSFGYIPRIPVDVNDIKDPKKRDMWYHEKNMKVFSLIHPQEPLSTIDLMIYHPIDFEQAYYRRQIVKMKNADITVASIEDLIALKKISGRPVDLQDIAVLKRIVGKQENEPGT